MRTHGSIQASTPMSDVSSGTASSRTKRPSESSPKGSDSNRRKAAKVSRACDHCKLKKLKCTGTIPCSLCTKKGLSCQYDAQYRRGRPPTPPAAASPENHTRQSCTTETDRLASSAAKPQDNYTSRATSRGSPGLETAEIEGQIVDPTSNLTFIHRAWKRLALQKRDTGPNVLTGSEHSQPLMSAGDKPFMTPQGQDLMFLDQETSVELFKFYFDNCVVTYRVLNQQNCFSWLGTILHNVQNGLPLHTGLSHAKAAIVVSILAIASLRQHKISAPVPLDTGESFALRQSEQYFTTSINLTAGETGLPRVESAQARVLQVLYLLQTSRMNQAWYVFGNTVPIVSALGLHRKTARHRVGGSRSPTMDYIMSECCKRTFWVVYTIDKYLAVVFGRPRFYHDDDVDQDYPDRVNDEDMTPQGPSLSEPRMDCHIDSLIFHARVARIIENTSREVYSLKPMTNNERLAAAQRFTRQLHEWREELPPYLGTVRPSSLIPSFGRQATALKLAYCHAIMHANRPFLLDHSGDPGETAMRECVAECISAAKMALETVDRMFSDGTVLFYALWWTPYVTFCALAIVYVWEIKQKANGMTEIEDPSLFTLAEQCQCHLAKAISSESASRRYSIIIEELRVEARHSSAPVLMRHQMIDQPQESTMTDDGDQRVLESMADDLGSMFEDQGEAHFQSMLNPLSQWQATDWLDLDSSVSIGWPVALPSSC
ncbi:fungal-specific transcription factor domain-containing protein [Ilyonectria robusta]|uniref:fungal-specific transcription factor domain-containing protein n=1 Tax=Ilyonectria robusta TaxID=1079257 RepID=UPI001E8E9215|nr:fungal-specific transcription factor domain-containing protein [Ilyonectria robusta]KAH8667888.1 fungal-specific transcription factor domain-containing protein [Ilyonectria robusta]